MTTWRQEYLLALKERDRSEQNQKALYDAYTKLADRTAGEEPQRNLSDRNALEANAISKPQRLTSGQKPIQTISDSDALVKTRTDLSEAQRSRGIMQSRLQDVTKDLQQLKIQSAMDRKRLDELTSDKATMYLRVKDRDEELKGKSKLLEAIHDETVSLTLQLNMAEDQAQKLRKENEELIERWMRRMGKEADAMNEASKFH